MWWRILAPSVLFKRGDPPLLAPLVRHHWELELCASCVLIGVCLLHYLYFYMLWVFCPVLCPHVSTCQRVHVRSCVCTCALAPMLACVNNGEAEDSVNYESLLTGSIPGVPCCTLLYPSIPCCTLLAATVRSVACLRRECFVRQQARAAAAVSSLNISGKPQIFLLFKGLKWSVNWMATNASL